MPTVGCVVKQSKIDVQKQCLRFHHENSKITTGKDQQYHLAMADIHQNIIEKLSKNL